MVAQFFHGTERRVEFALQRVDGLPFDISPMLALVELGQHVVKFEHPVVGERQPERDVFPEAVNRDLCLTEIFC